MSKPSFSSGNRVAVYARFSCDKQRDESIEDQLYEAERYCENRGYEIVKVYPDYAISGRSDDRPQFLQMIDDAKNGLFDIVLVWKMDRFARNMQDQFFHEKILNDHGVRLESIKENIAGNGIEASLSKGMHAIFAQIRSQQSAEDTMRGMLGKARKCQYLGYKWFGYSHEGDVITIDPAEAPIAREIHERYLSGSTITEIKVWLGELGVRSAKGREPSYNFVHDILRSWRYAGVYAWGYEKDARGNKVTDASGEPVPLIYVPDGMPAIVSREMKERCIRKLATGRHRNSKADYMLSGKLYCSKCGMPMHGETCNNHDGITFYRYTCHKKRRACCGVFWKKPTEEAVAQAIRDVFRNEEILELIAAKFARYRSGKKPEASIQAVTDDIKSLGKQRDNLIKAVEEGMPYAYVKDKLADIDGKEAAARSRLAELEAADREITKADVLHMLNLIADGARTDSEIISTFVSKIWLYEDEAVAILNITSDDCATKQEVDFIMKKHEPAVQEQVRAAPIWHPRDDVKRTNANRTGRIMRIKNSQIIMLDNGIGIVATLRRSA